MDIDSKFFTNLVVMFAFLRALRCEIMHPVVYLMKMMAMTYFKIFYLFFLLLRHILFNIIAVKT